MPGDLPTQRREATRLHQSGEAAGAAKAYAAYLARVPSDAGIWSNLGVLHRSEGRHLMALRAQQRAFALDSEDSGIVNNLANILSDIGQYDESIVLRRRLLDQKADDHNQKAMVGRCLRGAGRYQDAIDWLSKARQDHPDDAELEMQLAFAQLGAGRYADGLRSYKARWRAGELSPRELPFPQWKGEDLTGKTLAVLPEQGFGDAVLFARFLPVIEGHGGRVLAYVERPLARLLADLDGADQIVTALTRSQGIDYWVNMMDLAELHFARGGAVPPPTRLNVPQDSVDRARQIVAPYEKVFKVGLVWTGSVTYKGNAFRSFTHREFLPLSDIDGVQLFSLYKGPRLEEYFADGSDAFLIDAGSTERDFADCAAMMRQMNLVITSDTATAHIAGSLGIPVWTVLHWDAFWVWRHHGDTTEWYPGMRLFRQKVPLDWGGVMSEVARALRESLDGRL